MDATDDCGMVYMLPMMGFSCDTDMSMVDPESPPGKTARDICCATCEEMESGGGCADLAMEGLDCGETIAMLSMIGLDCHSDMSVLDPTGDTRPGTTFHMVCCETCEKLESPPPPRPRHPLG